MNLWRHNAHQRHSADMRWKYVLHWFILSILQLIDTSFFSCISHMWSLRRVLLFNGHHKCLLYHCVPCRIMIYMIYKYAYTSIHIICIMYISRMCHIHIYIHTHMYTHICVHVQGSWHRVPKTQNFLDNRNAFCYSEVLLGGLLG